MSNLMRKLLESVDQKDIIASAEGINGLIAVTKNVAPVTIRSDSVPPLIMLKMKTR